MYLLFLVFFINNIFYYAGLACLLLAILLSFSLFFVFFAKKIVQFTINKVWELGFWLYFKR